MSSSLTLGNRDCTRAVDLRLLRRMAKTLLETLLGQKEFDLDICLVGSAEMIRLNENFLRHKGSTDVITFDYAENAGQASRPPPSLSSAAWKRHRPESGAFVPRGEIVICLEEAAAQAHRFRTTWPTELARYLVHGVLHLQGFDDVRPADRRRMKREENRLLGQLARRFDFLKLAGRGGRSG